MTRISKNPDLNIITHEIKTIRDDGLDLSITLENGETYFVVCGLSDNFIEDGEAIAFTFDIKGVPNHGYLYALYPQLQKLLKKYRKLIKLKKRRITISLRVYEQHVFGGMNCAWNMLNAMLTNQIPKQKNKKGSIRITIKNR